MSADESAIGNYFSRWQRAAVANDLAAMLDPIADDAIFLVAGREPFGKREFAAMQAGMRPFRLEFESTTSPRKATSPGAVVGSRSA